MIRRIALDGRSFIVDLDGDGKPLSIKERRIYCKGLPYEAVYNAIVWRHSRPTGSAKALPSRILEAVKEKTGMTAS